ncbi:MAG TPA: CusA/CzcA family heavy metal efflux RND transporter, partial [Terriglobales bacterium]|nr:CusA/CzcA family heavy metal efflux RND transporter [Terriglobales bacterium]
MRKVVQFALNQPLLMILATIVFIGAGVAAFRSLPVEAFPDVTDTQVNVVTLHPGRAAEEVEKQVTIPLEIGLSGLPKAVRMFSHTQFGLSFLVITFDDGVDNYFARQQVLERLQTVDLPPGVQPQLAPLTTPVGEIFRYRLKGDSVSPTDLRSIQDWVVERYLKMVPGVADVVGRGAFIKQYQVGLDLPKMKAYGVTLQQVFSAMQRGNTNAGGSYLEKGEQQYLIRGIGLMRSSEDIGNTVVAEHNGTPLLVKDIAEVKTSTVPRQGLVGQDSEDEVVEGIVLMRKGDNPSEVLTALKKQIESLTSSILPKGVSIVPYYDRTWLIDTTLHTVFKNLLEGALLVSLILYIFLGNLRPAAIVTIIIPLSLLATFLGLTIRGIPANLLSLGAMDFGIIVDGAVIVVENIYRHLSEQHGERTLSGLKQTIMDATAEVGRPTLFSMLIIILAHVPIFTLQRHEGRIFAPMAYTVTSALIGSLIFSFTLVPLLCYFFLRNKISEKENPVVAFCKRIYRPVLEGALNRPLTVLAVACVIMVVTLGLAPRMGTEFLPELNEGTMWINVTMPPGISVSEVQRQCALIRAAVHRFPEVTTVISQAGRPEDGTDPKPINMAEFLVGVKPPAEWRPHLTREQLSDEIENAMDALPGIEASISQPIRDNVLESISQIDGQIVIKVFGEETAAVKQKAQEVLRAIAGVPGVDRAFVDRGGEVPQLKIEIDRLQAGRYGINIQDIQDTIETALGGKTATEIWEGEKRFGVVVRLRDDQRRNVDNIKSILIETSTGQRIPLSELAAITTGSGSMNISRENGMRVAAIGVFIKGRDMGGVVKEMRERVEAQVTMPSGYFTVWGGEFENQERAMSRLMMVVPLSVFLIFIVLFNAFGSIKHCLLMLSNVPFAMIGGVLALLLTGI